MSVELSAVEDISNIHSSPKAAVDWAIRFLRSILDKPRFLKKGISLEYLQMRCYLPYIIHDTEISGTQLLVNRHYKPVGSNKSTFEEVAIYENYKNLHVQLHDQEIKKFVSPEYERGLFGDGNAPWLNRKSAKEYLIRLEKLYKSL